MCCHAAIEESEGCVEYVNCVRAHIARRKNFSRSLPHHSKIIKVHTGIRTQTPEYTIGRDGMEHMGWNARVASRLQIFSDFVDEVTNLDSDGEIDVVTRMGGGNHAREEGTHRVSL